MNSQQVELWAREIVKRVSSGKRVEDSRVELKSSWVPAEKAAPRLGGHANAARGESILWLIGIDEKNGCLANVESNELSNWYSGISKQFDGYPPRLVVDVNVRFEDQTVIALFFETHQEAPYVVKSEKSGSFPERFVPWREGTRTRAAKRDELLQILVNTDSMNAIFGELEFNQAIADSIKNISNLGCQFRDVEFDKAVGIGVLRTLPSDVRDTLYNAYIALKKANQWLTSWVTSNGSNPTIQNQAWNTVRDALPTITAAIEALKNAKNY